MFFSKKPLFYMLFFKKTADVSNTTARVSPVSKRTKQSPGGAEHFLLGNGQTLTSGDMVCRLV
jgi:hypothetical protein